MSSTVVSRWPAKSPADILDFSLDWAGFLAANTALPVDTLSSVVWTLPAGLTKGTQSISGGLAIVWISGGVAGTDYVVTCRVTTANGRTIERAVILPVQSL